MSTLHDLTQRAIKAHTGRVPGAQQPAADLSGPATAGRYKTTATEVCATFRELNGIPQYLAVPQ